MTPVDTCRRVVSGKPDFNYDSLEVPHVTIYDLTYNRVAQWSICVQISLTNPFFFNIELSDDNITIDKKK